MAVERTTVRRCRKERPCDGGRCSRSIKPGELYQMHITGPAHELLENDHWLRLSECAACVEERTGQPIQRAELT